MIKEYTIYYLSIKAIKIKSNIFIFISSLNLLLQENFILLKFHQNFESFLRQIQVFFYFLCFQVSFQHLVAFFVAFICVLKELALLLLQDLHQCKQNKHLDDLPLLVFKFHQFLIITADALPFILQVVQDIRCLLYRDQDTSNHLFLRYIQRVVKVLKFPFEE